MRVRTEHTTSAELFEHFPRFSALLAPNATRELPPL